eukprot:jgi/Mesvir1/13600/Mv26349-RA.4
MGTVGLALRRVGLGLVAAVAGTAAWNWPKDARDTERAKHLSLLANVPERKFHMASLKKGATSPFDILIIGGGATGAGCALDGTSRGLNVALIEQEDFASGTSSRSTKLVHGGVRYLEKAVMNLDWGQAKLVFEALKERYYLLKHVAPHLTDALPTMMPCFHLWEVPFYWLGMKMYDLVAGTHCLFMSYFLSPQEARRQFPTLRSTFPDGSKLKGAVVYYDGQMDDSRLCVSLVCTAALAGATVANYTKAVALLKDKSGKVYGARVKDMLTGQEMDVHAKVVVNATGPFCDQLRGMSQGKDVPKMIVPSAGVHITLPTYYSPIHMGLIVPKTQDNRVIFMLPWKGATIAGTTDSSTELTLRPKATAAEVQFILDELSRYLAIKVRRSDIQSVWSGIRPLAIDVNAPATETASVSRDHVLSVDPDGVLNIVGGKWTTYRQMAEDTIDKAIQLGPLNPRIHEAYTHHLPLVGAAGYNPCLVAEISQNYVVPHRPGAIDARVAAHLVSSYGDRAAIVTKIAEERKLGHRLVHNYPQLEAEVGAWMAPT